MTSQQDPATGVITGLIPDHPPSPAYLYLPQPPLLDTFLVEDRSADLGLVAIRIAAGVGIHLRTAAQAREFVRAFALALEMLTPRDRIASPWLASRASSALDLPDLAAVPDVGIPGATA